MCRVNHGLLDDLFDMIRTRTSLQLQGVVAHGYAEIPNPMSERATDVSLDFFNVLAKAIHNEASRKAAIYTVVTAETVQNTPLEHHW
jgi:hypothetical protein